MYLLFISIINIVIAYKYINKYIYIYAYIYAFIYIYRRLYMNWSVCGRYRKQSADRTFISGEIKYPKKFF